MRTLGLQLRELGIWDVGQTTLVVILPVCGVLFFHIYLNTNLYHFYSIIHNERKYERQVYNAGTREMGCGQNDTSCHLACGMLLFFSFILLLTYIIFYRLIA